MNNHKISQKIVKSISIGIVGCGYWGLKLAKRFSKIEGVYIAGVFDSDKNQIERFRRVMRVPIISSADQLFARTDIDAVVIASPAFTHFRYMMQGLKNSKHIFVEKPMALTSNEALTILNLVEKQKRMVLVDHTYLYSNEVVNIKRIIDRGDLGHIDTVDSFRMGTGVVRDDCDVIWDLAVHDVAIFRYLFGMPKRVIASGTRYHSYAMMNRATITMQFAKDIYGTISVGWLYPKKIRSMSIVGTKGTLLFDDTKHKGKIVIYDHFLQKNDTKKLRSKVIYIAGLSDTEPLQQACEDFVISIRMQQKPLVSAVDGAEVVSILDACQRSIAHRQHWESI